MALTNLRTSADSEHFREDGVLALPGVIGNDVITQLREDFWRLVSEAFAISEDDPASWFTNPYNPAGDSRSRRLSGMNPIMEGLRSSSALSTTQDVLQATVDSLFGTGRWEPLDKWYSLLSFPGSESTWDVPQSSWHNDLPIVVGDPEPWTIFVFVFLDRVERNTGPTLAVAGSHRRGEIIAAEKGAPNEREIGAFDYTNKGLISDPATLRLLPVGELLPQLSATDEWFGELVGDGPSVHREVSLMQTGTSHLDIENRVVDLTGAAGDITLFDPRCLHSFSANVSQRPRQVLRLDFRRT